MLFILVLDEIKMAQKCLGHEMGLILDTASGVEELRTPVDVFPQVWNGGSGNEDRHKLCSASIYSTLVVTRLSRL